MTVTAAAYDYRGEVAAAVVAGKVAGASAGWRPLGRLLVAALDPRDVAVDVVSWVPADARRRRQRGFDHARLLAEPVAAAADCPCRRLLTARPGRPDQSSLPAADRRRLPDAVFVPAARLSGQVVGLVDDVLTTGATARAAARALAHAGAGDVHVLVLARADRHRPEDVCSTRRMRGERSAAADRPAAGSAGRPTDRHERWLTPRASPP